MPSSDPWLLLAAGVGAGLCGSIAGLASLVSYPALLAVGLAPLAANVTNTVALVGSAAGSIAGSRPELAGQRARVRRLVMASVAGGTVGAVLLLVTPVDVFRLVVPLLIGAASLAILLDPRSGLATAVATRVSGRSLAFATFAISVYGGYFGAAAGVLMLALVLAVTGEGVARSSALKNVTLGLANAVAALLFMVWGPVHWVAALFLGIGCLFGSRLGPVVVRHLPGTLVRVAISLAGVALAVHLGLEAYG